MTWIFFATQMNGNVQMTQNATMRQEIADDIKSEPFEVCTSSQISWILFL